MSVAARTDSIRAAFDAAALAFGGVDLVVNNAGRRGIFDFADVDQVLCQALAGLDVLGVAPYSLAVIFPRLVKGPHSFPDQTA